MTKVFEDYFTDLQADMVSICLEYVENDGEVIYIYCSYERKVYSVGYFYKINGKLKERHKVNEELSNLDVSIHRQQTVLQILMDDLKQIEDVCKQFGRPMPTEMKLIYDIKNNSYNASYQYELVYSEEGEKTADDIEEEWFEEVMKQNNQK
ncbi:hypothetical protein [Candidatus Enterococcus murrayae]|uniref:DUF600 domain-containing protein n=1 Tax=Candidatus Enterococcus murrayae TaxID=2815321 RepID=A0ABS3HG31_9ENTE|nr:hypothetical protein [Enterococcus sp. MJM16]MBO0451875.1 hypothetical protein [Enterococcus sp. MJM16]